jgi:hypothetical protein
MKNAKWKKLILLCLPFLTFFGCWETHHLNEPRYGSDRIISEERNASECNGISLKYAGNVYLRQGDEQSIRVEANDNIIDDVITRAQDGILMVGLRNGSYSDVTVRVYVTLKSIEQISIEGAGNINVQNSIEANNLNCTINGAGDIYLKGYGEFLDCKINGAGNIDAFKFPVKNCTAKINGSGNCSVNVSDYLDASILGVGNIIYDGNPEIKSSISGIGKITRR